MRVVVNSNDTFHCAFLQFGKNYNATSKMKIVFYWIRLHGLTCFYFFRGVKIKYIKNEADSRT